MLIFTLPPYIIASLYKSKKGHLTLGNRQYHLTAKPYNKGRKGNFEEEAKWRNMTTRVKINTKSNILVKKKMTTSMNTTIA